MTICVIDEGQNPELGWRRIRIHEETAAKKCTAAQRCDPNNGLARMIDFEEAPFEKAVVAIEFYVPGYGVQEVVSHAGN